MRKLGPLLCLPVLLALFLLPAAAYSDLPQDHWAYSDLKRASELGILLGYEDGTIQPERHLTWAQVLTMLGRTFYTPNTAPWGGGRHWASGAYSAALSLGVLEQGDFLPLTAHNLDSPVTRKDMAVLLDRTLTRVSGAPAVSPDGALPADLSSLPEPYRAPVLQCEARGLIKGYEDGRFGGEDLLTRAAGATLLVRAVALTAGKTPASPLAQPTPVDPLPAPTPAQPAVPAPSPIRQEAFTALGTSAEKRTLIYGNTMQTAFSTREEAQALMTTVTVPVWKLNKPTGEKTPSQLSFTVHTALAADLVSIFTDIFHDPEQFPIYSIGGYQWRGDSSKSEHNSGTAVDINYIENCQISPEGVVYAGECWLPGENPWSIPEGGSVVRIFRAHGYTWGGNGWPDSSPKDYMHFSYLGR